MNRTCALLLSLAIALWACAAVQYATGPTFIEASPPPAPKATLYFYRVDTSLSAMPTIKLNGEPFVEIPVLGYSYAYLTPGVYRVSVAYRGGDYPLTTEFVAKEGQVVFMRFYDTAGLKRISVPPEKKALEEIRDHRFVEPLTRDF